MVKRKSLPPTSDVPALTGTLSFMQLIWELHHELQARSKEMEHRHGVTGPQRLVLRLVGRFPGVSPGELAALLRLHPSTLTGVFSRLEARGLIRRKKDPEDARRAVLELTASGARIDARRTGTVEAVLKRALSRLSPAQVESTERALRLIIEEFQRG
jgi:DNA-binding MarR family transcriptional regulator